MKLCWCLYSCDECGNKIRQILRTGRFRHMQKFRRIWSGCQLAAPPCYNIRNVSNITGELPLAFLQRPFGLVLPFRSASIRLVIIRFRLISDWPKQQCHHREHRFADRSVLPTRIDKKLAQKPYETAPQTRQRNANYAIPISATRARYSKGEIEMRTSVTSAINMM